MFSSTAKMSVEASDVQSDEDCEELVEDGFSFSADFLEKKTRRKRSSKPIMSPKSPYLSSLSMKPRRETVVAWRHPRMSVGDARGGTPGDLGSARFTSLSNGHGVTIGTSDCRDAQDMYDEIIRLKKILQAHRSDSQLMKAKLRRLEEDNARREKQIEELLDPTKGAEYTRCLVDKKKDGSVVLNGLKQRILKLEQQCREKENALSKLQSELRTTNLDELKITVDTYFEEIQRLKMLLEAAEKSSRAESKCSQRQQKALSSTVLRLSESLTQLQEENASLREELNTDSPAVGIKGYREWSKQRLLRRLLEVEKKLEKSRRRAQSQKSSGRLDKEVQASTTGIVDVTRGFTMATEAGVSVGTNTEEAEEVSALYGRLSQLEKEGAELKETLSKKDEEMKRLKTERDKLEEETQQWKTKQMNERDRERQQHNEEMKRLETERDKLEEETQQWKTTRTSEWDRERQQHNEEMKRLKTERDGLEEETQQWKTKQTEEWDRERQQHTEEMKRLKTERDKLEEETQEWKTKQTSEWDRERQRYRQEMERLWERIQTLMEGRTQKTRSAQPSPSPTMSASHDGAEARGGDVEEGFKEWQRGRRDLAADAETRSEKRRNNDRERAARIIQKKWREHSSRDTVMLQSTLRGHILRESQLKDRLKGKHNKAAKGTTPDGDDAAVTAIQSAFRGHLTRCGLAVESPRLSVSPAVGERSSTARRLRSAHTASRTGAAKGCNTLKKQDEEYAAEPVSSTSSSRTPSAQMDVRSPAEARAPGDDSDDSDIIIVSPSRPSRRREVLLS